VSVNTTTAEIRILCIEYKTLCTGHEYHSLLNLFTYRYHNFSKARNQIRRLNSIQRTVSINV